MADCKQCSAYAGDLIAYGNTCCACGEVLIFGGWWGWHAEGFRAGPFCDECTGKPSMVRAVDDPSATKRPDDTWPPSSPSGQEEE